MENKEIQAYTGMIINGTEESVPFGNFIVPKPENEDAKQKTTFTGYDYMIKFNIPYKNRVQYPCKAKVLFQDICEQAKLVAGNLDFINCDYIILGNPFTNNEDCRTVLSNLAQLAGGFAKIGRNNKVYIKSLKNISYLLKVKDINAMTIRKFNLIPVKALFGEKYNAEENIDGNNYFDDFSKNNQWGELNSLVIGLSNIEGENIALDDKDSIKENGLTEIMIEDNYFLIDQAERKKVINPLWSVLKGIRYLPFKTKYYGYPYLDSGDMIYIQDTNNNGYISYVFNHVFKFDGGYSGSLETPALTKTQAAYKNIVDTKTRFRQAERKINKINGIIEDIIEENTETSEKLTKHEQDINSIKDTVSSIEDLTNTVEGNKTISLGNCVEGNLLELHIFGNNTVFDYLYPSGTLYPSDDLYCYGDSRIVVNNTIIYELGITDVLRKNGDICDEYVLKDGKAKVIRRINTNGTAKSKETEEDLGEFSIKLTEGTNTIKIQNYTADLRAKYTIKNAFTDIVTTKAEMNAKLELQNENINLELSKKTDNNNIIASINLSTEKENDGSEMKLRADKIDIDGKAVRFKTYILKTVGPFTEEDKQKVLQYIVDTRTFTAEEFAKYDINKDGEINTFESLIIAKAIANGGYYTFSGIFEIDPYSVEKSVTLTSNNSSYQYQSILGLMENYFRNLRAETITCANLEQTSLANKKKNFDKLEDALEIIKATDIYKYNLKNEEEGTKKHIGFVIGKDYKYSEELTSQNNDGVDIYSLASCCLAGIKEQQEQIEELQEQIKQLKEGKQNG